MYSSRDELIDRFGQSLIDDFEYQRPNVISEAIEDTNGTIDAYLAARYSLPLATVPAVLKRLARDLIRYNLDIDPDDTVTRRRDEAITFLKALSKNEVTLGLTKEEEPDSVDTAEMQNDGHVFSRANSKAFI